MAKLVGLILALVFGALALHYLYQQSTRNQIALVTTVTSARSCLFITLNHLSMTCPPVPLSHNSAEIVAAECSRKLDGRVRLTVSATVIGFASFLVYAWASLKELTLRVSYLEGNIAGLRRSIQEAGQHGNADR
jgi:hypothetical protein